jgi:cyclic pyranopterin phosphate synthase
MAPDRAPGAGAIAPAAPAGASVVDRLGRGLGDLRLSVTDRCNLRCRYCMPEEHYVWLARDDLLTFEEIVRLVDAFVAQGVSKVRLTGGEPLIRKGLVDLVRSLADREGVRDLAMTTNGVMLSQHAEALREAGLDRVTVSLDTLREERFAAISRRDWPRAVLAGIRSLAPAGFVGCKIDTVVMRGVNDDELADLIEFGRDVEAEVRFIEYMDVGGATRWSPDLVVSQAEILRRLEGRYGAIEPLAARGSAPAQRFALADGTTFGVVASMTDPFCGACTRSRLTADGQWYRCLYARAGTDLRTPLREGADLAQLGELIAGHWSRRRDQGAVDRLAMRRRGPLADPDDLRRDPHLEMHTRGG